MRTEVIEADSIDVAVQRILSELGSDTRRSSNRENTIYFDGWDGLGASAVLQAVAKGLTPSNEALTRPVGLEFQRIIHIDCSKWENRRAMQRKIVVQLKLPSWVIEMFDKEDEEDDFNGLDQGSRGEIEQVNAEINKAIQISRFLVILYNGGNEEIDISNFGLYLYGYANSKMLWTFRGRFRLDPKVVDNVKKNTTTHLLISASSGQRDPQNLWSYLVHHEAAQVSRNAHGHCIIDPAIVSECAKYMLKRCCIGPHIVDYDWPVHTSNYWVCDGIIRLTDIERAWQVGDVLQRELRLLGTENRHNIGDSTIKPSSHLSRSTEHIPYWISKASCRFVLSPSGVMLDDMFQNSHRLGVLKLSRCTFSFSSPPFLCCHSLRFLWLDHCQDLRTRTSNTDHQQRDAGKEQELDSSTTTSWECFQSLWVLDLRYTDCDQILSARVMDLMTQLRELNVMGAENWDMSHLQGRLRNILKLRITKSTCFFNNNVFSEMESMELLDFSGNHITQGMKCLSGPARNSSLKSIIIDGCDGLKKISFRGCSELENVFLEGLLRDLEELELSGKRVKTLNLTAVEARSVPNQIILLGCEKLHAILWAQRLPKVLHIDTTSPSATAYGGEAPLAHPHVDRSLQQQKEELFKGGWQISLTDARLLRSLSPVRSYLKESSVHIDVCPAATDDGSNIQGTSSSDTLVQVQPHKSTAMDSKYRDILKDGRVAALKMWDCPKIYFWEGAASTCIIKVIIHEHLEGAPGASTGTLLLPNFICEEVTSLHVYDNLSITSIPGPSQGSGWNSLRWCRVERCPRLHTVFTVPHGTNAFSRSTLHVLWVSKLLSALYIGDRPVEKGNFRFLILLHVDHCPRLVHVLPFSLWGTYTFMWLKTLEVVYCGDVREVFPLSTELQEQDKIRKFCNLRHIHLHQLPMLQCICGRRMSTPRLETIKIRGCWSLRRLPAVGHNTNPPKVDCEKEWWDNLEWDGLEENHHPSLYEPSH